MVLVVLIKTLLHAVKHYTLSPEGCSIPIFSCSIEPIAKVHCACKLKSDVNKVAHWVWEAVCFKIVDPKIVLCATPESTRLRQESTRL